MSETPYLSKCQIRHRFNRGFLSFPNARAQLQMDHGMTGPHAEAYLRGESDISWVRVFFVLFTAAALVSLAFRHLF